MDKRTKEYRASVRAEVNPDLVFIRQLDRMLEEFMFDRDYSAFFSTEVSEGLQDDVTVIREAQRRIHYIRLSLAFKLNEPDAEEPDAGAPTGPEEIPEGAQRALGLPGTVEHEDGRITFGVHGIMPPTE